MDLSGDIGHWKKESHLIAFGDIKKGLFGFVYKITLPNGMWYIGSKQFNSKRKLKPLKGRVNSRRSVVESDWRTYTSSSNQINEYIEKNSKENIKFEIIELVYGGKFELKYSEMKHQVLKNCLFDETCLNGIINVRLGRPKKVLIKE